MTTLIRKNHVVTITADYVCTGFEDLVLADATAGSINVTLADPSLFPGKTFTIKKTDSTINTVTIVGVSEGRTVISDAGDIVRLINGGGGVTADPVDTKPNANLIINGNFDFWQRGTSGFTGAFAYSADRWRVSTYTGTTYSSSRQSFTVGQSDVPNNPTYFLRKVVSAGAGTADRAIIVHRIESVRTLAGKTATISFWIKADASKQFSIGLGQYFGSGGGSTEIFSEIGVKKFSINTTWQKIVHTFNVPSISGKTLGTDNNDVLVLNIWFDAGSDFNAKTDSLGHQSGTFDMAQVKLEEGSVATPFVLAGGNIEGELAACQRYYEKSFNIETTPANNLGTDTGEFFSPCNTTLNHSYSVLMSYKVRKRANVVPTIYNRQDNSNTAAWYDSSGGVVHSATVINASQTGFVLFRSSDATRTICAFHWAASAEL